MTNVRGVNCSYVISKNFSKLCHQRRNLLYKSICLAQSLTVSNQLMTKQMRLRKIFTTGMMWLRNLRIMCAAMKMRCYNRPRNNHNNSIKNWWNSQQKLYNSKVFFQVTMHRMAQNVFAWSSLAIAYLPSKKLVMSMSQPEK